MRTIPLYQADAFTKRAFGGNPAAVVLLKGRDSALPDEQRQAIAAEMNLSETAFVEVMNKDEDFTTASRFRLRWFTPTVEVPLCGHATLAAAAVLYQEVGNTAGVLTFSTHSGDLQVEKTGEESGMAKLRMALPRADITHPLPAGVDAQHAVVAAAAGQLPVVEMRYSATAGLKYLMLVLGEAAALEQLQQLDPDANRLREALPGGEVRGVIVTAAASAEEPEHFASRFFAPWCGIDEDPATGSAHSLLAPYWAERLGTPRMQARQVSARGAVLEVELGTATVWVSGTAPVVLSGSLRVPEP